MRQYLGVLLIFIIAGTVGIASADIPTLVGNWSGPYFEYNSGQEFSENVGGFFYMNITEQQNRIFAGYTTYTLSNGTNVRRDVAGVISSDGTEISLTEQNNGYSNGKITGPDSFELIYTTDHDPITAAVDQFFRKS